MADNDFPSPTAENIIATGPELISIANDSIIDSFRKGNPTQFALPSLWRLAYRVNYQTGPLTVYRYEIVG